MATWPLIPEWMKDITEELPKHSKDDPRFKRAAKRAKERGQSFVMPKKDRTWMKRKVAQIRGVCFHQSWGGDDPFATNNYHTGPNHITSKGCPAICYTLYVDGAGRVYLCNPLHDIPWSQGTSEMPGSESRMFLSVCVGGKFRNSTHKQLPAPTGPQMEACARIWDWAQGAFDMTGVDIFGHFDFGKSTCPGTDLERWILMQRTESGLLVLADTKDWQQALVDLKYDLGRAGPEKNGVDGDWGPKSRAALVQFQRDWEIPLTGVFDRMTAWMFRNIKERGVELIEFDDASIVLV